MIGINDERTNSGEDVPAFRIKDKRIIFQDRIIYIICLVLIVFIFTWLLHTIATGRKNGLLPASGALTDDSSVQSSADTSGESSDPALRQDSGEDSQEDNLSEPDTDAADYEGTAENDDFSDACFIGDSRTVGLELNADKPLADFYASQGLSVNNALTEQVVTLNNGNMGTVIDGAAQKQYGRIFVMFGINELGWPYPDNFTQYYVELIEELQAVQPDAQIYIQSVLPVSSKALEEGEVFTNENIDAFNEYVRQAAAQTSSVYLDINPYFKDENGSLPEDASTDGIHFGREYCLKWIDILAYLTD